MGMLYLLDMGMQVIFCPAIGFHSHFFLPHISSPIIQILKNISKSIKC